jgi:hypothetical protein
MGVLRRAAVLVLLALSLGTSGVFATTARSEGPPRPVRTASRNAVALFDTLWSRVTGAWTKAGCTISPWGQCLPNSATQTQNADAGCRIDPLGSCSTGQ